jgi:hypothetical protein
MNFEQWVEKRTNQKNRYDTSPLDHLKKVDVEVDGRMYRIPADEPFLWQKWSHEGQANHFGSIYKDAPLDFVEHMKRGMEESWDNCKFYFKMRQH